MEPGRGEPRQEEASPVASESRGSARWSATALVLVISLLIGSVIIPARFTSRILALLRESHGIVEPARQVESQLELDLDLEATTLQEYLLTGGSVALRQQQNARSGTDRDLAELTRLGPAVGPETAGQVAAVRAHVNAWRDGNRPVFDPRLSRGQLTSILRAQQRSRDSTFASVTALEWGLARAADARGDRIARFEEASLTSNASLVLLALAAMLAVAALVQRERHLAALLERRMENESALRAAAEAFASVFANDDVTNEVARRAMAVLRARAAFAEVITDDGTPESQIVVCASIGLGAPRPDSRAPLTGSLAEAVLASREPLLVPCLGDLKGCWFARDSILADCSAIVVPLVNATTRIGAVVALSDRGAHFTQDDLSRARIFGHLVTLAYEKIRLLSEARDRRRELERVMNSRSRLMRGFSHDIKNPLGAADGYADLLAAGMFGPLSVEQRESVDRLRRSIQSALALISDLHEFARADTGHIALCIEPVLLRDVIRASNDEFRAAAVRRGLSLSTELPNETLLVSTDELRVRQILSNLLSNAIKYTKNGSIVLRLQRMQDETGTWATIGVEDTGEGIAPDQVPLLFEEFVRLTSSNEPGAGLGLAISMRLANALGGRLTVRSELGRGSCFTLWLPIADAESVAASGERERHREESTAGPRDVTAR
jgi:signal transduction histidine kinase